MSKDFTKESMHLLNTAKCQLCRVRWPQINSTAIATYSDGHTGSVYSFPTMLVCWPLIIHTSVDT